MHRLSEEDVQKAIELMQTAKKPMIFVGGGAVISGAQEELKGVCKESRCTGYGFLNGKRCICREPMNVMSECLECMEQRLQI